MAQYYEKAIKIYKDKNSFSYVAKLHKEMGQSLSKTNKFESAAKHLNLAGQFYESEDQTVTSCNCFFDEAVCRANTKQFLEAAEIFEKVAQVYVQNKLLRWSAKDCLFSAFLCRIAIFQNLNISDFLSKYCDIDSNFASTREYEYSQKLVKALNDNDSEKFSDALYEADSKLKLDNWKVSILVSVREKIGENVQVQDEDDFT
ncbi:hypothetical protein MHBO_004313 [Bonamia ostreae]|uniref:Alpha-SNAP n=1 Tax=Bonamia ostreae TaxID=126728 RepID=A0ABV2ASZ1_9EUKA